MYLCVDRQVWENLPSATFFLTFALSNLVPLGVPGREYGETWSLLLHGWCLVQPAPRVVSLGLGCLCTEVFLALTHHPLQPGQAELCAFPSASLHVLPAPHRAGTLHSWSQKEAPVLLEKDPKLIHPCLFLQVTVKQEEMWVRSFGSQPSDLPAPTVWSPLLLPRSSKVQGLLEPSKLWSTTAAHVQGQGHSGTFWCCWKTPVGFENWRRPQQPAAARI